MRGTGGERSAEPAPLLSAYLSARAEETLALLLEGLSKETARELRRAVVESTQGISAEISAVRQEMASSQRDLARVGRELVRSGVALEAVHAEVSALGPSLARFEDTLRKELADERNHAEPELADAQEILATLDGLEIGLQEGRELARALAAVQYRLQDTTVQRWWRAMAEAIGVSRPLPDVPVADLDSLVTGLELTYRRLEDALARHGVTAIESVGKRFDPYAHEAVAAEPCAEGQDGLVLREQKRGYRTGDRIVRLSQVVVGRSEASREGNAQSGPSSGSSVQSTPSEQPGAEEGSQGSGLRGTDGQAAEMRD